MALLKDASAVDEFEPMGKHEHGGLKLLPVHSNSNGRSYADAAHANDALDVWGVLVMLSSELHLSEVFLWRNKVLSFLSLSVVASASFSLTRMNLLYVLGFQSLFLIALCLTIRFFAGDELKLLGETQSGRLPYPDEMESNIEGTLEVIVSAFILLYSVFLRNLLFGDMDVLAKYVVVSVLTAIAGHYIPLPWLVFHGTFLTFALPVILNYYGKEKKKAPKPTWIIHQFSMATDVKVLSREKLA